MYEDIVKVTNQKVNKQPKSLSFFILIWAM